MLFPFDYYAPPTLEEASRILREIPGSRILVGGTDLLVKIRDGSLKTPAVVDLKKIPDLDALGWEDGHFFLGAAVSFTRMMEHPEIQKKFTALLDCGRVFGCFEIRHRATVAGNVANASPGAESAPPLFALDSQVEIFGPGGYRRVSIRDFYQGAGKSCLETGEILTRLLLPRPPKGARSTYLRRTRVLGQDLASVSVSVFLASPGSLQDREIRIAMGAVAPVPVRATATEELLKGQPLTPEVLSRMRGSLRDSIQPRSGSLRATPEYKKEMVGVLTEMALHQIFRLS